MDLRRTRAQDDAAVDGVYRVATTSCPLDCPDHCSLVATVDPEGRVVKLDGDHRNPATDGFLCNKVRHFPRHVDGPRRLRRPAVRIGVKGSATFREVSWDEALDRVAEGLRQAARDHGAESIVPFAYGGSNGILSQDTIDLRLFRRLGASRLDRTVCAAANGAANIGLYGAMPGVGWADYREASLIVVWGANPASSGIHLMPPIVDAQKAGAKLVVIDPRRTRVAARSDLHLAVRPGTDLPLALAMHRWLFESGRADLDFLAEHADGVDVLRQRAATWTLDRAAEVCGVDAAAIEAFARLYAESSPAVIRLGWGFERNRNGGSAAAAVLALPAVAAKFGVRGGGFTAASSTPWRPVRQVAAGLANEPERPTRQLNMNRLGRYLVDGPPSGPPIQALFVFNANPVATLPRQDLVRRGLEREDLFTVVHDAFLTDTARFADVVLPATTFLEHEDLRASYGTYVLQAVRPVAARIGEARPNTEVFDALVHRLGLARPDDVAPDRLFDTLIERAAAADALSDEQIRALTTTGTAEPGFGPRPIQFVDLFPATDDGKIHLAPAVLDRVHRDAETDPTRCLYAYVDDPADANTPLALISPATSQRISSTLGDDGDRPDRKATLTLHPDDAAARHLASGDLARIWNDFGEVVVRARLSDSVRPGVVSLPKGLWSHATENGATSNVLVPDSYTDLGGGACFNDARVQVARIEAADS